MLRGEKRRALPMDLYPSSLPDTIPSQAAAPEHGDPAEITAIRDSVRLAFVTALQHLPPRQRAALILCEVLRMPASEAAVTLDATVASVNSALQRARATLAALPDEQRPADVDAGSEHLLARYVDAFQRYDMTALLALIHEAEQAHVLPRRAATVPAARPACPASGLSLILRLSPAGAAGRSS
jgi:RNA polymerase sigma-70 factor (ECF subfamily)